MALRGVDGVALFDFTAILSMTIGTVRNAAARFAVGAPLTGLWHATVDGPLA